MESMDLTIRLKTPRIGEVSMEKCLVSRCHDRDTLVTIVIYSPHRQNAIHLIITTATRSHDRDMPTIKRFSETTSSFVFR